MTFKDTPFGKIPDTWGMAKISEITKVVTDYVANGSFASLAKNVTYKDEEDVAVLIRLVDYNNDFKGDFVFIDEHAYEFLAKSKLYGGEIIISNVGANVGTVFRCPYLQYKMSLAPNAIMVQFIGNDSFYYHWLKGHYGQKMLKSIVTGSAQPKFNKTNFRDMLVPVPPVDVQNRIAIILDSIEHKIEQNTAINENLEQQAQAIFKSWFVDFEPFGGVMPTDWRIGTFSDIIDSTLGGDWGKEEPTDNYTEQVYCIRGADIPEVKVGNKGKMPTRYILPKNFKAKQLIAGDIVVEISGGSPTQSTGRVAVISKALLDRYDKGIVCTNFCRAVKPMIGYSKFIYYYWKYLYDIGVFFSYENGTTGIKNLDISGFIETEIITIPPIASLNKFNDIIEEYFSQIFENGQENEQLSALRDTLLPKLMSGEIDVSKVKI